MKISKSKQELARIISENGGWRDECDFAAQDRDSWVCFYDGKPTRRGNHWLDKGDCQYRFGFSQDNTITNWHQAILSRDEYFHLYPVAAPAPEPAPEPVVAPVAEAKPTIEQLAADYRNRKDYADRKQQEADAAKADAEAKLADLVAAGNALGLVLSVAEPELVITDWRDLLVGDIIEYVDGRNEDRIGMVGRVDRFDYFNAGTDRPVRIVSDSGQVGWPTKWRFIRRP